MADNFLVDAVSLSIRPREAEPQLTVAIRSSRLDLGRLHVARVTVADSDRPT
jgi:hypothetical protein